MRISTSARSAASPARGRAPSTAMPSRTSGHAADVRRRSASGSRSTPQAPARPASGPSWGRRRAARSARGCPRRSRARRGPRLGRRAARRRPCSARSAARPLAVGDHLAARRRGRRRQRLAERGGVGAAAATPLAPRASTISVSLVDSEPSTETRLNDGGGGAAQQLGSSGAVDDGIGRRRSRSSSRRRAGSCPRPCAITPMRTSPPLSATVRGARLGPGVGRADRVGGRRPAVRRRARPRPRAMPASTRLHRQRLADHAGRADDHLGGRRPSSCAGRARHRAARPARPCAPVHGVGVAAELTTARARGARRPGARATARTGAPAARRLRVNAPAAAAGAVGDHEREVGPARGLDAAGHARRRGSRAGSRRRRLRPQ